MSRKRMEPTERRQELIDFGCVHFAAHAFDALSVEDIAVQAGVSKGTIYNYFGGRRGFYVATIAEVVNGLLVAIEPAPDAALADVLPAMTRAFVDYAAENEGIYLALVRGGLGADDEVAALLERVRIAAVGHIRNALGDSVISPRLDLAIGGWVSFVEATTARWLVDRQLGAGELVDMYAANLFSLLEQNR